MADRDKQASPSPNVVIDDLAPEEQAREFDRLISLSDGVFAFAMTLLIVSIGIPELTETEAKDHLVHAVLALWPQMLSYVIGFMVIGLMWSTHRKLFARVRFLDDRLTWLNILLLMMVAFLPFPTEILGVYGGEAFPSIFYSLVLISISTLFILIVDHLEHNRALMTRNGEGFDFGRAKTRNLVTAAVFLISIPISVLVPGFGQFAWFLLSINHRITEVILPYLPERFRGDGQA